MSVCVWVEEEEEYHRKTDGQEVRTGWYTLTNT